MHPNSERLFRQHAAHLVLPGAHVLEIAPDAVPSSWRTQVTVDVHWEIADLVGEISADGSRIWGGGRSEDVTRPMTNEYEVPSPDGTFDLVLSGSVIEHVRRPWTWMAELARITKPGGLVVTVGPVSWPYHEAPVDCWRIYPEGMKALCEHAGLNVERSEWESLEDRPRRWFPGASYNQDRGRRGRAVNAVLSRMGWPLPIAFDTLTIARKPIRAA
jgi:SAM-dependent methyltransferase